MSVRSKIAGFGLAGAAIVGGGYILESTFKYLENKEKVAQAVEANLHKRNEANRKYLASIPCIEDVSGSVFRVLYSPVIGSQEARVTYLRQSSKSGALYYGENSRYSPNDFSVTRAITKDAERCLLQDFPMPDQNVK